MLTENDIKEELSYAYVHAIASRAGYGCDRPSKDRDSIDVVISAKDLLAENSIFNSPTLGLQLKATSGPLIANPDGHYPFVLPIKNYIDLRKPTASPRLLVLFHLPEDDADWLESDHDRLLARRAAYWCNLRGQPEADTTTAKTVYVPQANLLTGEALTALLAKASRMEEIGNVL